MFKEAESRPDKIESTSNNVQVRKKQQHRRRACDLLASLKRFYWPSKLAPCKIINEEPREEQLAYLVLSLVSVALSSNISDNVLYKNRLC